MKNYRLPADRLAVNLAAKVNRRGEATEEASDKHPRACIRDAMPAKETPLSIQSLALQLRVAGPAR